MQVVNLAGAARRLERTWEPRVAGTVNGHQVKVVRFQGDFVWHAHEEEDEACLVLEGSLVIRLREGELRIGPGDFAVGPRGVEHRPEAAGEVLCALFAPASTVNTGSAGGEPRDLVETARADGPFRALGYNSPRVPAARRFWELQVPVRER